MDVYKAIVEQLELVLHPITSPTKNLFLQDLTVLYCLFLIILKNALPGSNYINLIALIQHSSNN